MSRWVLSDTSWPTICPSDVAPMITKPPLVFRKPHKVSPARESCAVDFLNSTVSD
jgi:hypothetical protein